MDTAVHTPPPLAKPAVGVRFQDPVFGTWLRRLTDVSLNAATGHTCRPEYSTICPWSSDGNWLLLEYLDHFGLYTGTGDFVEDLAGIGASDEPRWSHHEGTFYYIKGNMLRVKDVEQDTDEAQHAFTEYQMITGKGESDTAQDLDALVLCGTRPDGVVEVFVYNCETDEKYPAIIPPAGAFDSLYISPSAEYYTVTVAGGIYLFQREGGGLGRIAQSGSHMDITRVNGVEELIRTNSADPQPLANCQNGIVALPLLNEEAQRCLLPLDWSLNVHFSCSDVNKVAVETWRNPGGPWVLYTGEILLIDAVTAVVARLCHTRTEVRPPVEGYSDEALASISRKADRLVFGSNWGMPGGPMDAYLAEIPVHRPHHGGHWRPV